MKSLTLFLEITHKSACFMCDASGQKSGYLICYQCLNIDVVLLIKNFEMHLTKIGVPDPSLVYYHFMFIGAAIDYLRLRCRHRR